MDKDVLRDNLFKKYFENQDVLNLSTTLEYKIFMDNAWTYFFIDFINASTQLGFQTSNQFLYEQYKLMKRL